MQMLVYIKIKHSVFVFTECFYDLMVGFLVLLDV